MMRLFLPIILIIAAITIFAWPTRAIYSDIAPINERITELEDALDTAEELSKKREELQNRYNNFRPDQVSRLEKMLPSHVDNVRLIIDLNSIAGTHNMSLRNVRLSGGNESSNNAVSGTDVSVSDYNSVSVGFTVDGTYVQLKRFLNDLAESLRIVDVNNLSFSSGLADSYEFNIDLTTYWINENNE